MVNRIKGRRNGRSSELDLNLAGAGRGRAEATERTPDGMTEAAQAA